MQGGGYSLLTAHYGLAVDNVVQVEIVTADSRIQRANACENSDLFWAVRGGGGGTWGVVTDIVYKVH